MSGPALPAGLEGAPVSAPRDGKEQRPSGERHPPNVGEGGPRQPLEQAEQEEQEPSTPERPPSDVGAALSSLAHADTLYLVILMAFILLSEAFLFGLVAWVALGGSPELVQPQSPVVAGLLGFLLALAIAVSARSFLVTPPLRRVTRGAAP